MRKIGIQNAIAECVSEAVSLTKIIPLILKKTAKRLGLSLTDIELHCVSLAIQNIEGSIIRLDLEPPCGLGSTLEEMQVSLQRLIDGMADAAEEVQEDLTEAVSRAIPNALRAAANVLSDNISGQALSHTVRLRREHAERVEVVRNSWGRVTEDLDVMRHIVLEWAFSAIEERKGAFQRLNTAFVLNKLFIRLYEIVGEIIVLIRAGYADGAFARWRSLHEICVIAMFLSKQTDNCAKMYLEHHKIEELRLNEANRNSKTKGMAGIRLHRYMAELRMKKTLLVKKFGMIFAADYGWASVELGCKKITFRDLETHVGLDMLRRGYQRANSAVHGGALAALTRISLDNSDIDSANVSPAHGCDVAINYASSSLSMTVAELCLQIEDADLLTMSIVIHNYREKIGDLICDKKNQLLGTSIRSKILARKVSHRKLLRVSKRVVR